MEVLPKKGKWETDMPTTYDGTLLDHLAEHMLTHFLSSFSCCAALLSSPHAKLLLHRLSSSSRCAVLSSSCRAGWLFCLYVPPSHRLIVSLCRPLIVSSRQLIVVSSRVVLSCSHCRTTPSIAIVAVVLPLHHPSPSITVAIVAAAVAPLRCHCCCCHRCPYHRHHHRPLLLIPSLVGRCIVVCRPLLSSHAVMRPLTLLLPAAFADNCLPPPPPLPPLPPPPPPLPLGQNHRHCHNRGQTHHRTLTKKKAAAAPPPAYQLSHHCENVYKSRQLGLI